LNVLVGARVIAMIFGHNSNITIGSDVVHVQTEDRGAAQAAIDTTVHWKGRVLHRRTNKYGDLLPLDGTKEAVLKSRLDEQHRAVVEEIRSGALKLVLAEPGPVRPAGSAGKTVKRNPSGLKLELLNPNSWRSAKLASLHLAVRDHAGRRVNGAEVRSWVEGGEGGASALATTDANGETTLQFEMPKPAGTAATLVIEAKHAAARVELRFQLRTKPRV